VNAGLRLESIHHPIVRDLAAGGYITVNPDRTIVLHRKLPARW
jgi:hypothetical protein